MRRRSSKWLFRSLPVLAAGLIGLILLPAGQQNKPSVVVAAQADAPTARSLPAIAKFEPVAEVSVAPLPPAVQAEIQVHPGSTTPVAAAPMRPLPLGPSWTNVHAWSKMLTVASALPANAAKLDGRIGDTAVNARSAPSSTGAKLFTLAAGEPVKLGSTSGGWVEVERQDGSSGWVYGRFLAGATAPSAPSITRQVAAAPTPPSHGRFTQVVATVPVLSAPSDRAGLLFVLQPGELVHVAEHSGNWVHVFTEDGASGWMPT